MPRRVLRLPTMPIIGPSANTTKTGGFEAKRIPSAFFAYAPTQHQFKLPFQRRKLRDIVKLLDGARKWQSKVTGAMVAGAGYFVYIARYALGSCTNMVLTVLVLALQKGSRPLGARLHVQLNNTSGENKNQTMIAFLALLVQNDIFYEAAFF
eukprot:2163938-Pleurochrysis_carterae.AAC.1